MIKLNDNQFEVLISEEYQEDYGNLDHTATEIVTAVKLNKLPKDEVFKTSINGKSIYTKYHYDRESKTFCCENVTNGNERFFKSNKTVYTGFIY